jgi:hypothetical protein
MSDYIPAICEPMRSWSALQSRPRTADMNQTLKAAIHDPLWMLARQFQFGEFKGEDAGSAVFVKIKLETSTITKYQTQAQAAVAYTDTLPLEARVERRPITLDYRQRAAAGQQWLKILDRAGASYNAGAPAVPYVAATAKTIMIAQYPFELPAIDLETDSTALAIEKAKLLSNRQALPYLTALVGRAVDGAAWYDAITATGSIVLPASMRAAMPAALWPVFATAMTTFVAWIRELYCIPTSDDDSAWNPAQLEYQFRCAAPAATGNDTVLSANEYYQGRLDLNAFNLGPDTTTDYGLLTSTSTERSAAVGSKVLSVLASDAGFGGMPSPRWWEFEDGAIDLGNFSANTTEVAKIILAEFALMYSNDWLLVPHTIPVGTLANIAGIVITDTFGQRTLVEAVGQGDSNDWQSWTLYNLTKNEADAAVAATLDHRLFLVPAVALVQESEPLETVSYLRDETANMVWGVETRIPDLLGGSMDGQTAQRRLSDYLAALAPVAVPVTSTTTAETTYKIGNTVPENWIPFISIHRPSENRAMQLQRASMPRYWNGEYLAIRPRTEILRTGMHNDSSTDEMPFVNAQHDTQDSPYFIYEEEVPSTGVAVQAAYNRTRWYDGKTLVWYALQKKVGRGEGASGIKFDIVTENNTTPT